MEFGMNVKIKFHEGGTFGKANTTLYNVTEVHYNYPSLDNNRVAFESDVHGTGCTYDCTDIHEFEVTPATKRHDAF